mmetsp:Transcript_17475/g.38490  ORF Transcript_17475/g.38490 Transcript_17475/m.38490 type:complete len:291 (-) Transcript_17475:868-1740(-)
MWQCKRGINLFASQSPSDRLPEDPASAERTTVIKVSPSSTFIASDRSWSTSERSGTIMWRICRLLLVEATPDLVRRRSRPVSQCRLSIWNLERLFAGRSKRSHTGTRDCCLQQRLRELLVQESLRLQSRLEEGVAPSICPPWVPPESRSHVLHGTGRLPLPPLPDRHSWRQEMKRKAWSWPTPCRTLAPWRPRALRGCSRSRGGKLTTGQGRRRHRVWPRRSGGQLADHRQPFLSRPRVVWCGGAQHPQRRRCRGHRRLPWLRLRVTPLPPGLLHYQSRRRSCCRPRRKL